jgi:hypothetical protein
VNSLLDYEEYARNSVRLQQTKIDPGNKLSIYGEILNKGVYRFDDTLTHVIRYEVTDVAGNQASLTFKAKAEKTSEMSTVNSQIDNRQSTIDNFNYSTPNHFNNGSVSLDAPRGVFYDSFTFTYDSARKLPGTFSVVHKIHNRFTPIHDYITLSIKAVGLPESLSGKALIVKIKEDGKGFTSAGGNWEGQGYVTAKIREFGDYSIAIDTVPPKIKAVQPELFAKMAGQKLVKLVISDELSGIASYRGLLNGKWILMDYDAKNDLLVYTVDEFLLPGKNTLLVEVRDGKNNRAFYSATINL